MPASPNAFLDLNSMIRHIWVTSLLYMNTFSYPTIPSIHGKNTLQETVTIVLNHACVMQKIIRDSRKPRDSYESEGVDAPQSNKQIQSTRYLHNFRRNKNEYLSADEVLAVVGMVSHDNYVQNVMITKKVVIIVKNKLWT